jgi:hypothetical protein
MIRNQAAVGVKSATVSQFPLLLVSLTVVAILCHLAAWIRPI